MNLQKAQLSLGDSLDLWGFHLAPCCCSLVDLGRNSNRGLVDQSAQAVTFTVTGP